MTGTILGFILLILALGGAGWVGYKTSALSKRGCGGGCGTCGNRNFCHRREELLKEAKTRREKAGTVSDQSNTTEIRK